MQVDDGLAPLGRQQEPAILLVVHEQILSENCRAERVLQHIERRFDIRITVGIVRADLLPGQVLLRSQVQTIGNVVGFRVPREGVGAPAAGGGPDAVSADGGHLLRDCGARGLAGSAILSAAVLPPGRLPAIGIPAGAGDCGGALRRRGAVSLSQDCQDESGGNAEE